MSSPMRIVRHLVFNDGSTTHNRIAVAVDYMDKLSITPLAGHAMPASIGLLRDILNNLPNEDGELLINNAVAHLQAFGHRWSVEVNAKPWGTMDFTVREEFTPNLYNFPVVGRAHISSAGKFNQDLKIPLVALAVLLANSDFQAATAREVENYYFIDPSTRQIDWQNAPSLEQVMGAATPCQTTDADIFRSRLAYW